MLHVWTRISEITLSNIRIEKNKFFFHQLVNLLWNKINNYIILQFSSVQLLSCVRLFATPWIAACQTSLFITNFLSSLRLTSIESVMPSSHLILYCPSSCPQSLPASGSFPMSQFFAWGGQSTGVSALASVLSVNTQNWSPL